MTTRPADVRRPNIFALLAIGAFVAFSMQIIVPALPVMARDLRASPAVIQLSLTLFMVTVSFAQLFYGPYSDRHGRRRPLIFGMVLAAVFSIACIFVPDAWSLVLARIGLALGVCAGMVLCRAMVRDSYPQDRSAVMMAYLNTGIALGPMLAPLVGGVLTIAFGWRSMFVLLSMIACALVVVSVRMPETHFQRGSSTTPRGMLRDFRSLVLDPRFSGFAFAFGLQAGTYFLFAGSAAFLTMDVLGRTEAEYGAYFVVVPLMYLSGNLLSVRLAKRFSPVALAVAGTVLTVAAGAILLVAALLLPLSPLVLFLPMIPFQIGQGLMSAPSMSIAIGANPRMIGSAAGLFGFIQMMTPAAFTLLIGVLPLGTAWPMGAAMFVTAVASLAVLMFGVRTMKRAA